MKGTSTGYDPLLGQKVAQESTGYVIGLGGSSQPKSEKQVIYDWISENGRHPSDQELHDAMNRDSVNALPRTQVAETEEADGARAADLRIAKYYRNNPDKRDEFLAKVQASRKG